MRSLAFLAPRSLLPAPRFFPHLPRGGCDHQRPIIRAVARLVHANQDSHSGQYSGLAASVDRPVSKWYARSMEIIKAKALPGYRLELQFSNGENGVVDLSDFVGRGVFASWQQSGVFEQVAITSDGAVEWPGEIDMCPDALYLRMTGKRPEDLFPSLRARLTHA